MSRVPGLPVPGLLDLGPLDLGRLLRGRGTRLGLCRRGFRRLRGLARGFPRLGRLSAESLGEALDAPFGINQLLASREERMALVADVEMHLGLRRPGLERRAAGTTHLDFLVLWVN